MCIYIVCAVILKAAVLVGSCRLFCSSCLHRLPHSEGFRVFSFKLTSDAAGGVGGDNKGDRCHKWCKDYLVLRLEVANRSEKVGWREEKRGNRDGAGQGKRT